MDFYPQAPKRDVRLKIRGHYFSTWRIQADDWVLALRSLSAGPQLPSDSEALILSARKGDDAAVTELVTRYLPMIRRRSARYFLPMLLSWYRQAYLMASLL